MRFLHLLALLIVVASMVAGAGFLWEALDSGDLEWVSLGVLPPEEEHEKDHEELESEDSDSDALALHWAFACRGAILAPRFERSSGPPKHPDGKRLVRPPERHRA